MDRRTVALGIAAVAAVAAAVIVTVARGRGASPKYKATASYIKSVDAIQQQMRVQLTKTTKAYRDFAGGKINPSLEPELRRAKTTLHTLEVRLTALPAPAVAANLRALLVGLAHAEVGLAVEVAQLAVFAPKFSALLRQSRSAGNELSKALGAVKPPKAHRIRGTRKQVAAAQAKFKAEAARAAAQQADAVDAYDAKIGVLLARLRRLRPPPVMRPALETRLRTFEASRTAGAALAQELRKPARSRVSVLGRRFTVASRGATTISAQDAQIAAIKSYNRRVRAIGSVQGRIQLEIQRLQRVTS